MYRLDVAVVGFVVFTVIAPFGGGYLAAWLIDSSGSAAMVAVLGGGTDGPAVAAAIGSALALAVTLRFTAGSMLDSFVSAWPESQFLLAHPGRRLVTGGYRAQNEEGGEVGEEGPLGLGGAVGWVGAAVGATLIAGMSISAWPELDASIVQRVGAGTASTLDWVAAAFPIVARALVASILGVLAGAVWSIFVGPAARMTAMEEDVEKGLDALPGADARGPDLGQDLRRD